MAKLRLSTIQRLGVAATIVASAGITAAVWPTAADALQPVQTAWWNVSGAPAPSAPSGGLHISVAPGGPSGTGQVLAFGAVLYQVPDGASGTLELKLSGEGVPNPNPDYPSQASQANINLAACPTTQSWKAGDNQAGPGPTYDCTHEINGNLSADNKTATFFVDTGGQQVPGQLSLAIVPVMNDTVPVVRTEVPGVDMTEPFSVDVDKPAGDSLLVTGGAPVTASTHGAGNTTPPAAKGSSSSASTGSSATTGGGGSGPVNISVPAGTTTAPTDSGSAPVVAPNQVPAAAPAAAERSTSSNTGRDASIALLILLAAAVLMTNNRMGRVPKHALAAAVAANATPPASGEAAAATPGLDAALLAVLTGYGSRGLGRFSKPRSDAPRPLV